MKLGEKIALFRKQKGWRQKQLAAELDVHPRHITRWETGKVQPRPDTLNKLARLMGTTVEDLRGDIILPGEDELENPELHQLLGQVHKLNLKEQEALVTFLQAMLTRSRIEEAIQRSS